MSVEPQWIDYNGHLNMAYYNVLFDRCVDLAFATFGLGPGYVEERGASFFTAEAHLCYLRELRAGDDVIVTFRLLDHDARRAHSYMEMHHAGQGWLGATSEQMHLHVDMGERRVVPWPDDVAARLAAMAREHAGLEPPSRAGRRIAIPPGNRPPE